MQVPKLLSSLPGFALVSGGPGQPLRGSVCVCSVYSESQSQALPGSSEVEDDFKTESTCYGLVHLSLPPF